MNTSMPITAPNTLPEAFPETATTDVGWYECEAGCHYCDATLVLQVVSQMNDHYGEDTYQGTGELSDVLAPLMQAHAQTDHGRVPTSNSTDFSIEERSLDEHGNPR